MEAVAVKLQLQRTWVLDLVKMLQPMNEAKHQRGNLIHAI